MNKADFGRHGLKSILVPTDFSESSDTALHIAIDLAIQQKARIYFLHVTRSRQITDQKLLMNKIENQVARFPEVKSINIIPEIRTGTAYEEIIKMQLEKDIDLIAISGHFRTGSLFDRFRNITAKIKRKAPCSVLVVGI